MIKTFKTLIILCLISAFQPAIATVVTAQTSDEQIQKDILMYVNQYRVSHGKKPFEMNSLINKEATIHSRDMATHRISFGHKYFSTRIKHLYREIKNCRAGAENVAFNYKDTKELVRLWLQSPGHKRNIDGDYNLTGIGVARDSNGKMYYTQMFLRTDTAAKH
jgi:uncharacterized protein YkwD